MAREAAKVTEVEPPEAVAAQREVVAVRVGRVVARKLQHITECISQSRSWGVFSPSKGLVVHKNFLLQVYLD